MKHKPLGDTKKLKKGEQVLICRGIKYAGRTEIVLDDGSTAPIVTRIIPFVHLDDSELGALNIKANANTHEKLLREMRKDHPDFQEHELVTIIFIDIERAVPAPKGGKGKDK